MPSLLQINHVPSTPKQAGDPSPLINKAKRTPPHSIGANPSAKTKGFPPVHPISNPAEQPPSDSPHPLVFTPLKHILLGNLEHGPQHAQFTARRPPPSLSVFILIAPLSVRPSVILAFLGFDPLKPARHGSEDVCAALWNSWDFELAFGKSLLPRCLFD